MESMVSLSGATPENKNITNLAKAIVDIIGAGGDREVTVRALQAFEMATHVQNSIMNCSFVNKVEKE